MRHAWTGMAVAMSAAFTCSASGQSARIYELTIEGKRVGYSRYSRTRTAKGRVTRSDTSIKVSLLGASFDMRYDATAVHSPDGRRLIRYTLDFRRGDQATRVECVASGKTLKVSTTAAGKTTSKSLPWSSDAYLIEANSLDTWNQTLTALPRPLPQRFRALEPLAGTIETISLRKLGVETMLSQGTRRLCDRVRAGEGAGAVELLIGRDTREVVEMRVPDQKAVFRLADASALTGIATYDAGARLFSFVDEPLPDPQSLTLLKVHARIEVAGEKPTSASLQSAFQTFDGKASNGLIEGVFETKPFTYAGASAPKMPASYAADARLAPYLKPEPRVECDSPEIVKLAGEIVDGADTTWDAVVRIGKWIQSNITYKVTGSGALECLRTKTGDCGPHAWLTIALCRAAGIPARITGGVLYSRALGGSFGQHYWTRVWMGSDGWVPIDTTTHEVGTLSPAHITLWNLAGLKSVSVKVLDYAPKPQAQPVQPASATYRFATGDSEKWVFVHGGKEIGEQTAECVATGENNGRAFSDWTYAFRISVGEPPRPVTMAGDLSIWEDGSPRRLTFAADSGGVRQTGSYTFAEDSVKAELKVGETPVVRSLPMQKGQMLQMNNVLTVFQLAMRSLRIKPGETRTASFFAAASMQRLDMTFKAEDAPRNIRVLGADRSAVVCDVQPIANRFFLDAETGEILRVEIEAGDLVIERR